MNGIGQQALLPLPRRRTPVNALPAPVLHRSYAQGAQSLAVFAHLVPGGGAADLLRTAPGQGFCVHGDLGTPGDAARVAIAQMVRSGPMEIRRQTIDKYGRTVAEVFVGGRNVNLDLVRGGYAFAYRKHLDQCDQATYLNAEAWAQRYAQGVWRYGTERPWEFRQKRREGQ